MLHVYFFILVKIFFFFFFFFGGGGGGVMSSNICADKCCLCFVLKTVKNVLLIKLQLNLYP